MSEESRKKQLALSLLKFSKLDTGLALMYNLLKRRVEDRSKREMKRAIKSIKEIPFFA